MQKQISPAIVIGVLLVAAVAGVYFLWIRPSMQEARIKQEWTSPEAVAKRGPDAPKDPSHEAFVQQLRQQEGVANRAIHRRSRE